MHVFRLMAMPDKVIAFDSLPERLLLGFEMSRADGFPRHWKEWLGKRKKVTMIPPEKDFLTGQVRRFDPIVEENFFFYLVDWTINSDEEKWKEICDYVRQHVSKDVRLKEKIEDMALPLAANKTDGVTLEPEDVPVIPLPKEEPGLINLNAGEPIQIIKCTEEGCKAEFEGKYAKNALRMHRMKKHEKEKAAV